MWDSPFLYVYFSWWGEELVFGFITTSLLIFSSVSSVTQSCLTLCDPMDYSMPGLPVHRQLLELAQNSCPLSWWCHLTISSSVIPFSSLPSVFPSIRVFSNESVLCIRWPEYWSFSFSISPSNEYSGQISFRLDWFDLLAVRQPERTFCQPCNFCSACFLVWYSVLWVSQGFLNLQPWSLSTAPHSISCLKKYFLEISGTWAQQCFP